MTDTLAVDTAAPAWRLRRLGVVGCGQMGAGVAEIAARAGLDVRVAVSSASSRERGLRRITGSLDRAVAKAKIGAGDRDAALDRISFTTTLDDLADREAVVEAVPEHESTKLQVFALLDKIVADPEAILASNTSSLPIVRLARAAQNPGRVVGLHFFNPVPVLPLVEVVGSVLTDERTVNRAEQLATEVLGKTAIRSPDRAGFLVNALLFPYLLAAVRMVEAGIATPDDVDRGMVAGCSHPMGPLRLLDLIGLDTTVSIADALYAEFKEPLYAPPPLLLRMVDGGLLGRKTGRGFYEYA
ncbi:3-hydroxybutyryl-CoA dehydrogenase [Frankia sp. CNm7]|uniref:3-hydroxybutyryl-CoA dehydrogenase n=1 Tax=Frankia nepalensis TaxID=1836974 RepID=A0A937RI11_9ACTN|nr:3-hydroxybutyryl-CoA dehydrogenase [Frankia nepalensis]MBL7502385.1 3-hydroxybutyryl-CoA dehydrogenase [Frankia nepalensis]MBL7516220.1 3-hydroxybutyryl-CoA dehydrogenase [Frankia nepalensis]MBL7519425.1 3-hydroxybutyryl-CoA dehydrogenase [Frankia nepalensis]MBL7629209.1 3-hydroxybutyryl-CoA dehydrogenase [Frankia nepalensis]